MSKKTMTVAAATLAALWIGAAPAQAATAVSASMSLQAQAQVGDEPADISSASDAWGTTLSSLAVNVSATGFDAAGAPQVSAFGSGQASWTSADAGSVSFRNVGWAFDNGSVGTATVNGTQSDWVYQFTATGNGSFQLHYDVSGSGDTFGLWGWGVSVVGGPQGTQEHPVGIATVSDPTTTFDFSAALTAGSTYTVTLANNANISGYGGHGAMNGQFDWQISAVPEPASVALMLAGLGLVAGVARRHR